MTVLKPQEGDIPLPVPGVVSRTYWEGCAAGELRFQRCGQCGGATHTPAVLCAHCTSTDLRWEVSSGRGTVYSWTAVWRPQTPAFEVPYVPLVVEMEEGWFMPVSYTSSGASTTRCRSACRWRSRSTPIRVA